MAAKLLLIVIAELVRVGESSWDGRTLKGDLSLVNGRNWEGGRAPCEADRVVFRQHASLTLTLPHEWTSLRGLVLPSSAELLLPLNGALRFTGKTHTSTCDGRDVVFAHTRALRWLDPRNWDGWTAATPDLERVPCATDAVRIPSAALNALQMTMPPIVTLGQLEVNGKVMDRDEWYQFVTEGEGSRQFTIEAVEGEEGFGQPPQVDITLERCHSRHWCDCQNDYLRPLVCPGQCPVPLCKQPVQPKGFCCPFCGAYFVLHGKAEDAAQLREHLDRALGGRAVAWHATWLPYGSLLQVVLANKGDYDGDIRSIATDLKASLQHSGSKWSSVVELHASGHVWRPTSLSDILLHFLSLLVFAALTLAALVVFYSQNWNLAALSHPVGGRPFMFARFVGEGGEGGERVVVVSDPAPTPDPAQSFDNPMYGNPTSPQKMKDPEEEQASDTVDSPLAGQTFDNPMYGVAQQEDSTLDSPVYCELAETAPKYSQEDTETLLGTSNVM